MSSGVDPGLVKDGVEAHLQELLAAHVETFGDGYQLVRREYPTPVGPVDILLRDPAVVVDVEYPPGTARHVAIEIKRRAGIDAVEQLTRYLDLLNRDPLLAPVERRARGPDHRAPGPHARRGPRHSLRGGRL